MKCPKCGSNIEVTEFDDETVLVRQDCLCKLTRDCAELRRDEK